MHLCIINLVIGTLYCAKGNFPFGIVRVMKSMEPLAQKLETDTWFYVKRCFLALVEGLTKHMIALPVSDLPWLLLGQGTAGCRDGVSERPSLPHGCPAGVWMWSCCYKVQLKRLRWWCWSAAVTSAQQLLFKIARLLLRAISLPAMRPSSCRSYQLAGSLRQCLCGCQGSLCQGRTGARAT